MTATTEVSSGPLTSTSRRLSPAFSSSSSTVERAGRAASAAVPPSVLSPAGAAAVPEGGVVGAVAGTAATGAAVGGTDAGLWCLVFHHTAGATRRTSASTATTMAAVGLAGRLRDRPSVGMSDMGEAY